MYTLYEIKEVQVCNSEELNVNVPIENSKTYEVKWLSYIRYEFSNIRLIIM